MSPSCIVARSPRLSHITSFHFHVPFTSPSHVPFYHPHNPLNTISISPQYTLHISSTYPPYLLPQVEFAALSALTGQPAFAARAHHTSLALAGLRDADGLVKVFVHGDQGAGSPPSAASRGEGIWRGWGDDKPDARSGDASYASSSSDSVAIDSVGAATATAPTSLKFSSAYSLRTSGALTLNALGDSYYEYLLKTWISTGQQNPLYRELYVASVEGLIRKLWKGPVFGEKEESENQANVEKIRQLGGIDSSGNSIEWQENSSDTSDTNPNMNDNIPKTGLRTFPADMHGVLRATETDTRPTPVPPPLPHAATSSYYSPYSLSALAAAPEPSADVVFPLRVSNHVLIDDGRPLLGLFSSRTPLPSFAMDHLSCFIGGTLALGVMSGAVRGALAEEHLRYAKQITRTCALAYIRSPTGLGPEEMQFDNKYVWEVSA